MDNAKCLWCGPRLPRLTMIRRGSEQRENIPQLLTFFWRGGRFSMWTNVRESGGCVHSVCGGDNALVRCLF